MATALLDKSWWSGEVAGAAWGPSVGTFLVGIKSSHSSGEREIGPTQLRSSASKKGVHLIDFWVLLILFFLLIADSSLILSEHLKKGAEPESHLLKPRSFSH